MMRARRSGRIVNISSGLGSLATLGEITCLLTAVILTPAALHLHWRRKTAERQAAESRLD